ncbi:MAG: FkbM family methyltransferase [Microcystis aeruginosa G13-07]|jgi:FkbM family methyltransferase|nr:FkbM family methyltransferase [Microcystis aeruginosa G13-10]NCS08830.1 FkbM family methyltransferase [Microcystis aeruginosa G13-07]NCS35337.1 FkbM family methyltransferase [Microcystis aeruginosa G11-01]NCS43806.1 FkbM family methyltransferase [Microcystis aeruginosa BS11-05]
MLNKTIKNTIKSIISAYKSAEYPLLPITKFLQNPMYWLYHQSPLLRHDSKFYLKPFLLRHIHDLLIVNHPQDFKIYGEKINFRSYGSLMSVQGYYVGEIEYHLVQYIVSQIKPGFVMLDIGAHHGVYTLIVAYELKSRGWTGVIHSFEPNPLNFSLLEHNVKQNQLTDYVILHNEAVSNTEGRQKLLVHSGENSGCQLESVEVLEEGSCPNLIEEYDIKVCQLDSLISQLKDVKLIKMDIQGAETFALQGGENIIKRDKPILVVEAVQNWSSTEKTKEFLNDHNYEIYGVSSKGKLCQMDSPDVFVSWDWVGLPLE